MEVDKGSDQKWDVWPLWMAAHARLKNEFTEDEKYHNLMMAHLFNYKLPFFQTENLSTFFLISCDIELWSSMS